MYLICNKLGITKNFDGCRRHKKLAHITEIQMYRNIQLFFEIIDKSSRLLDEFGPGSFMCSFKTLKHMISFKFDLSPTIPTQNGKFPIIGNGQFKYVPYHSNHTKNSEESSKLISIHYMFPGLSSNGKRAYHSLTMTTRREKALHQLVRFEIFNVRGFLQRYPRLCTFFNHNSNSDKLLKWSFLMEFRWYLSGKLNEATTKETVLRLRDRYFPQHIISQFLPKRHIKRLYTSSFEGVLTDCVIDWIGSLKKMRKYVWCVDLNAVYQLHCLKPVIQVITSFIIANGHCNKSLMDDFINSSLYAKHLRKEMVEQKPGSFYKRENEIINRLIGRRCNNCDKKERRDPSNIQYFTKCGGCQKVNYCSRRCQKIDWKYCHRFECKS